MSLLSRVQCRAGCGDAGDPELAFLCVDCHGDRVDARRERELQQFLATKQREEEAPIPGDSPPSAAPPSINHERAFTEFLGRARETEASVVARENQFLARELEIRETSRGQLRKYMVATDEGEPADPKEWGRYKYGAPRAVPRHDVDEATERAAQLKLFCAWRKRSTRVRVETRRQLVLAAEQERSKRQSFSAKLLAASPLRKAKSKSAIGAPESRRETLITALQGLVPKLAKEAAKSRPSLLLPSSPSRSTKSVDAT